MIRKGLNLFTRLVFLVAGGLVAVSCGSGSVGTPPVNDPTKITILPDNATLYSGLPTTFSITGGTGAYIVSSSNQAVVQLANSTFVGSAITVVPNPVSTDTTLTITARDTGTAAPVSVTMTVKPGTVSNSITIKAGSTACDPAICSGGDALVSTLISQGGIPLAARGVRFDVISGDFAFITSAAGAPETTASSVTTGTDETGTARARLRVSSTAANQIGVLQVTDLGSGAFQRTTIIIARTGSTQSGFFTVPTAINYTGADSANCAGQGGAPAPSSDVFIFGGTPAYTVSNSAPGAFIVSPTVVTSSGASFHVTPTGCADNAQVAITDAVGRTITVALSNKVGTATPPNPITFAPSTLGLSSCATTAGTTIVGGSGTFVATEPSGALVVTLSGRLLTVKRTNPGPAPAANSLGVAVTDGTNQATIAVALSGNALRACPTSMTASPASLTFTGPADCSPNPSATKTVTLSGGTGTYTASSNNAAVTASVVGSTLTVTRLSPSPLGNATITFNDANDTTVTAGTVAVTLAGACP